MVNVMASAPARRGQPASGRRTPPDLLRNP